MDNTKEKRNNNSSETAEEESIHIPQEYRVYLDPNFDAQEFANSVLNAEAYHSTDISQLASGDVSTVLSKLNLGIEDITKQIKAQVTTHHLKLLTKASSLASLDQPLRSVKNELLQLESNLERLHKKIGLRYATLDDALGRLDRYQAAAELSRRTSRFVTLAKRLEAQITQLNPHHQANSPLKNPLQSNSREQHELVLAESALTLSEIEKLLDSELEPASPELNPADGRLDLNNNPEEQQQQQQQQQVVSSIRSLKVIQPHVQTIVSARKKVEEQMSKMLQQGLVQLDRSMLSSAFQTAYNLSILDQSVGSLIFELTDLISKRIKLAFDLNSLAREAGANEPQTTSSFGYKSRARTEPTPATVPQWTSALWGRLEGMIDDLSTCCVKVYTLEKVLEWKKDPITGVPFLDVVTSAGSMLEERPSTVFWTTLSSALSKETREILRTSNFIAQTLTGQYPHLLRLLQEFFSRISLHTHTLYNAATQSPETVVTLRAVMALENVYLNRAAAKMADAGAAPAARADKLTSLIVNELDAARFDPLLVRSVARKAKEAVDNYLKRIENKIVTDYQSTSLVGPVATASQVTNMDIFNTLSELSRLLGRAMQEYASEIQTIMQPAIALADKIRSAVMTPILAAMQRELSTIVSRMHTPPRAVVMAASNPNHPAGGGYMHELRAKMSLVRHEILARVDASQLEQLLLTLTEELLKSFMFHASLMTPLSEAVKLRLAGELAELEFEVTQFMAMEPGTTTQLGVPPHAAGDETEHDNEDGGGGGGGDAREAGRMAVTEQLDNLKLFRQLLFAERPHEVDALIRQSSLDRLTLIHHLIVKYQAEAPPADVPPILLIHQRNAWSPAEYCRWVQEYAGPAAYNNPDEPLKIFRAYLDEFFSATPSLNHPSTLPNPMDPHSTPSDPPPDPNASSSPLQWLHMARQLLD